MVILGLGSNVGDRLAYLRNAFKLISLLPNTTVLRVSPIYHSTALLPSNAPEAWNKPYLNGALLCKTTLTPSDFHQHLQHIEIQLGSGPGKAWGPRTIDIDILAWDQLVQDHAALKIPHPRLLERPFALMPLADLLPFWIYPTPGIHQGKTAIQLCHAWGSRFTREAPFQTHQIQHRIDTPQLMGVLNLTPDSFSDGGHFASIDQAVHHAKHLSDAGADIIDIGAEATGPNAHAISPVEEWDRLYPVLTALLPERIHWQIPPKISIDTYHPETAEKALMLGVDWINDVSGLTNPMMQKILSHQSQDIVMMHQVSLPKRMHITLPPFEAVVEVVYQWAENQLHHLETVGISRERIILDVGLSFGKTPEQSLSLIHHSQRFHALNTRLLLGHSRKSMFTPFTTLPPPERDIETLALSLFLMTQKIEYLRVHDVASHSRAFKVAQAATVLNEPNTIMRSPSAESSTAR